jgi:peptidyl-tRNA hydrolase
MDIEDIKLMKDPDCYARMRLGIGLYPWQEKILRAWVLRDPRVASAVIGASSVAQLRENVAALANLRFDAAELAALE